jgi:hypothetical protein
LQVTGQGREYNPGGLEAMNEFFPAIQERNLKNWNNQTPQDRL